jgi:hypothetical protein
VHQGFIFHRREFTAGDDSLHRQAHRLADMADDQMVVAADDLHLHTQPVQGGERVLDPGSRVEEQQKAAKGHVLSSSRP